MTIRAVCLMDTLDDGRPMATGTLGTPSQSAMGVLLMAQFEVGGIRGMTIDAGAAMTAIDGLVVDGLANG